MKLPHILVPVLDFFLYHFYYYFDCVCVCVSECVYIEHGEKERSWKRESKVVNLFFTISCPDSPRLEPVSFYLFILFKKKKKKWGRRRKSMASAWLIHSFSNQSCCCLNKWKQIKQAINLLALSLWSGAQQQAFGGGGFSGSSGGLCRVSCRPTDPRPFLKSISFPIVSFTYFEEKIKKNHNKTQLFAASLRTIVIIYTHSSNRN